jgi:HSP20 family protein
MYFEFEARTQRGATWTPMVDVCERDTEIVIFVEMPGVDKSDVQLSWNQGVLIISGQKRQHVPGSGRSRYLCLERAYGQFRREIEINVPIDRKAAKAELDNGLLRIRLPKASSGSEPSNIPIL